MTAFNDEMMTPSQPSCRWNGKVMLFKALMASSSRDEISPGDLRNGGLLSRRAMVEAREENGVM